MNQKLTKPILVPPYEGPLVKIIYNLSYAFLSMCKSTGYKRY